MDAMVTVKPIRKGCDELFSVLGGEGRRWKVVIGQRRDGGFRHGSGGRNDYDRSFLIVISKNIKVKVHKKNK